VTPDPIFSDPQLAALYDPLDADRSDLDHYEAILAELGARSVLDVGCGTGTFACRLAQLGLEVTGVDPAAASIELARRKPGAERVRWIVGEASDLPALAVDVVPMTGNVAQVFVEDGDWATTLRAVHGALRDGGTLTFETRDPSAEAWTGWTKERSYRRVDLSGIGVVETWVELIDVCLPLVAFRSTFVLGRDGRTLTSDSTLRFRSRPEIEAALDSAGFQIVDVRDAPDRPGLEHVVLARRSRSREDGGAG
jgi:ubiquinone/menaquinone biosynthesis C-methylase UbiE